MSSDKHEETWPIRFENVIVKKVDGSKVSPEEALGATINFPMWFGEDIIKEVNDKKITVIVLKGDRNNVVCFATNDVDLILRAETKFLRTAYNL